MMAVGNELELAPEAVQCINGLRPIPRADRSFSGWDIATLWLGMVVNVSGFYLAGSLIELGMSWWQGVATIVLGNTVLLAPLILTAYPGTRYGISFPVLARASFGVRGVRIPGVLRALAACGWCSIESWIGGGAIFLVVPSSLKHSSYAQPLSWLGTSPLEFSCFLLFMALQLALLWKGMAGIRVLNTYAVPLLVGLNAWLFGWACIKAGGFGEMLSAPSTLSPAEFWSVFFPALTASISSWAGVAVSIADFSQHARSQADQAVGQLGLPLFMGLYTFAGLAITSSTPVIFGRLISNPIQLLGEIGGTLTLILSFIGVILAVVTTNIPASIVGPANVFVGLSPSTFSFLGGALLTAAVSIAFQPWRILQSSANFIFTFLVGYSAVLGPISGILLADYYVLHRMVLDVNALYSLDPLDPYYYVGGYNVTAIVALVVSVLPTVPGFLHKAGVLESTSEAFVVIYGNAWFFGFFSAAAVYCLLSCISSRGRRKAFAAPSSLLEHLHP